MKDIQVGDYVVWVWGDKEVWRVEEVLRVEKEEAVYKEENIFPPGLVLVVTRDGLVDVLHEDAVRVEERWMPCEGEHRYTGDSWERKES